MLCELSEGADQVERKETWVGWEAESRQIAEGGKRRWFEGGGRREEGAVKEDVKEVRATLVG